VRGQNATGDVQMRGGGVVVDGPGVVVVVVGVVDTRSPRQDTPASWSCPQAPLLSWNGHSKMLSSLPEHWTARSQTVRLTGAGVNRLALPGTALASPLTPTYNRSSIPIVQIMIIFCRLKSCYRCCSLFVTHFVTASRYRLLSHRQTLSVYSSSRQMARSVYMTHSQSVL